MKDAPAANRMRRVNLGDAPSDKSVLPIRRHVNAIAVARAFAAEAAVHPAVLFVVGPTGVGKTELVQQLASDVSAKGRRRSTTLPARDVVGELVEAIRNNIVDKIARRFGRPNVVVIEDVSDLRDRPASQTALRSTRRQPDVTCDCAAQTDTERDARGAADSRHDGVDQDRQQSLTELATWCNGDARPVGAIPQLEFEAAYAVADLPDPRRIR